MNSVVSYLMSFLAHCRFIHFAKTTLLSFIRYIVVSLKFVVIHAVYMINFPLYWPSSSSKSVWINRYRQKHFGLVIFSFYECCLFYCCCFSCYIFLMVNAIIAIIFQEKKKKKKAAISSSFFFPLCIKSCQCRPKIVLTVSFVSYVVVMQNAPSWTAGTQRMP